MRALSSAVTSTCSGDILTTTLLGDTLEISPAEIGTDKDSKKVFCFDLPLKTK